MGFSGSSKRRSAGARALGGPSSKRRITPDRPPRERTTEPVFPDPSAASPEGLLAIGGDLSPARLLAAYAQGVFPWYSEGEPILWWCPDPRLVLEPGRFHASRSLRRTLRRKLYEVRADTAFASVIERCATKERPEQDGTWITPEMKDAYIRMHELGFGHSLEAFEGDRLVGGVYGISLGRTFFGESMFSDRPDASKVALAVLMSQLAAWEFDLLDCQVRTTHLVSLGAREIPRSEFLARLAISVERPTRPGPWRLDPDLAV